LPQITVVVPTLAADRALEECLAALEGQTCNDFEIVVVDNSGKGVARRWAGGKAKIMESASNLGYGGAINAAGQASGSAYIAALNDDAVAAPGWLDALIAAMKRDPRAGMCASRVRLQGTDRLDSAGMLLYADGTSKQRGQGRPASEYDRPEEVLMPSGSAALYRRAMLEETGWFDEEFFLYCEDTDLGLRARWAGWKCLYVPEAEVEHRYSHSTGAASPLKAYYVERNRLRVVVKNYPPGMLALVAPATVLRYLWHALAALSGRGAAGEFRRQGWGVMSLIGCALRAHVALACSWRRLWRQRKAIRAGARITAREFASLARRHSISAREVAWL
jgi:GT2 family glycosyltransferase